MRCFLFSVFYLAKPRIRFIIEQVPRCAWVCFGFRKKEREYEIICKNSDGRPTGEADPACQPAAGSVEPAASAVQHVGRGRGRPVRRLDGSGRGGFHQHFRHPVHRFSHRPEQRHQRVGRPFLRCAASGRCSQDRPLGDSYQFYRRHHPAAGRSAGFACPAPSAEHQRRPSARRDFILACLLPRYACPRALQFWQRGVQCHR